MNDCNFTTGTWHEEFFSLILSDVQLSLIPESIYSKSSRTEETGRPDELLLP